MPTTQDRSLEMLDDAECRRLLTTATIGRLGFTDGALPAIVPVPFALHDDSVLIPTRRDSGVARAVRGAVVALQVDSYRDVAGPGWSVTVVGPARLLSDPRGVDGLDGLNLFPPSSDPARCYITVRAGLIRGWRAALPSSLSRTGTVRDGEAVTVP